MMIIAHSEMLVLTWSMVQHGNDGTCAHARRPSALSRSHVKHFHCHAMHKGHHLHLEPGFGIIDCSGGGFCCLLQWFDKVKVGLAFNWLGRQALGALFAFLGHGWLFSLLLGIEAAQRQKQAERRGGRNGLAQQDFKFCGFKNCCINEVQQIFSP